MRRKPWLASCARRSACALTAVSDMIVLCAIRFLDHQADFAVAPLHGPVLLLPFSNDKVKLAIRAAVYGPALHGLWWLLHQLYFERLNGNVRLRNVNVRLDVNRRLCDRFLQSWRGQPNQYRRRIALDIIDGIHVYQKQVAILLSI